jgi:hypothetical protein
MLTELEKLLQLASTTRLTADEQEEQRRSFAYGNAKIENARVTRETVNQQAEALETIADR